MKKTSKKGSGKKLPAAAASAASAATSEASAAASAGSASSPADSAASAGTAASTGSAASAFAAASTDSAASAAVSAVSEVSEVSVAAPAGPQRLDKLLGQEGLGTRSELKKAVRKGRVTVNGAVEKDPGRQITAEDRVCFDGEEVRRNQYVYYMLNKPAGVITATEDGRMRTVLDLLREPVPVPEEAEPGSAAADSPEETETSVPDGSTLKKTAAARPGPMPAEASACSRPVLRRGLFPVGRLDRDTEGLLLITDDGQLAHRLLSPVRHVDKTYYAVVTGRVTESDISLFAQGFRVDDELTAMPAVLRIIEDGSFGEVPLPDAVDGQECTQVSVTIREGKFHQIKRMFAAVGKEVLYLKRLSMGTLQLDTALKPGQFRELTKEEIAALKEH